MAGDWIKMRANLGDDPAVIAIARALHIDADAVVGKLHRLWAWADQHTMSGRVDGVDGTWIDNHVSKKGFAAAMARSKWLYLDANGVTFPHFDRHNGKSAKVRAEAAERKRLSRDGHEEIVTDDAEMSQETCDKSVTREEKRSKELKSKTLPTSAGFEKFWDAWPSHRRKADKAGCFALWKQRNLDDEAEIILAHVASCRRSSDWVKDDGEFIPAPGVYLKKRRYEAAVNASIPIKRLAL